MASGPSISYGSTNTNSGTQVGVSNGTINVFQERAEPRPDPLLMIPFPRDPDFVGRKELLDQIHEKASVPGSRIAIVGIGGIGKTQLAVEYCHQVRELSADTWVFWVHASNVARCEKSLRDIANRAKVPGNQDINLNANIFKLVGNWLQDGNIGKWLLILDNVDDDGLLRRPFRRPTTGENDPSSQPPLRKLLESSTGTIIVTSRNRRVALDIAGHSKNIVGVQPINQAEALDLLQKKLSPLAEQDQAKELAQELEHMPLAIVQAAAYIQSRLPRYSVSRYLLKLRKSDREVVHLLREEAGLLHRDWEAKNSILLTWQISFDYIRSTRSSATDLLSLMSFFDRQGIAESILRVLPTKGPDSTAVEENLEEDSSDDIDSESNSSIYASFEKDFMILSDFSLISVGNDDSTSTNFTMHRLVQLTVRTWLKVHGQLEQWKEKFIEILDFEFPPGRYENWEMCRTLFPHVKAAVLNRPRSREFLEKWASMLYRGAWYAHEIRYVFESMEMASLSRDCRLDLLGEEDEGTLESADLLASIYRRQGQLKESEQLITQVLNTRKKHLGDDHRDTLRSMSRLASTLSELGRWEEAKQLETQVLEVRRRELGERHHETWRHMSHLALTLSKLGRLEEAKQLETEVLEHSRREFGESHPETLTSMGQLASTLSNLGQWEEAEQLQVQVLEKSRLKYGMDHPDTLTGMNNLGLTMRSQGRYNEAENLQTQVLKTRNLKLGASHPDTLVAMNNMALTLGDQGRFDESEQLGRQVLETRKTKLGLDHPDTLTSMSNLAYTLRSTGQNSEAINLMRTCFVKQQKTLGLSHPVTEESSAVLMEWEIEDLAIDSS